LEDLVSEALKHTYARTNQFEVAERLAGLQEKFRVLNYDTLADALRDRLGEAERVPYKWTPEVLSLFLQLSDRPAQNSRVEDLELLKPPESPAQLTWSGILADDPLDDEDGVWSTVDFAAKSSEDEGSLITPDRSLQESKASSVASNVEEDYALMPTYIVAEDSKSLDQVFGAQFWTTKATISRETAGNLHNIDKLERSWLVTELQAVREILFMLSGLPTSLFSSHDAVNISVNTKYALHHSSENTFHHILQTFAVIGTKLDRLREWAGKKQDVALVQTFGAALEERLRHFDSILSEMQSRFVASQREVVVSLLALRNEVQSAARPLLQLSEIVADLDGTSKDEPFRFMDLLFDQASLKQASGDHEGFECMAKMFFQCFQTYLKPIEHWMDDGELRNDEGTFFISMKGEVTQSSSLWSEQYQLLNTSSGHLLAPTFLHTAVKQVFNIGKSVVFLKKLGSFDEPSRRDRAQEFRLTYDSVCSPGSSDSLIPFSELFNIAFDNWMHSRQQSSLSTLRDLLYSQCGLWRLLDALEYIYFLKDGALSTTVAVAVFDRIDRNTQAWNDRYILTELFRGVYGSLESVDAGKLSIRSTPGGYRDLQNKRRSVKILGSIIVEYNIPWAIANIVRKPSIVIYQRICTLLLQIRRAKHLLERQRLLTTHQSSPDNTSGDEANENSQIYALRLRLLVFTNALYAYLTETALAPSAAEMRKAMAAAGDVDAMIAVHEWYITHLEAQCLLSQKLAPIHQAIISLLDLAILFSDIQASYNGERQANLTNRSVLSTASTQRWRRRRSRRPRGRGDRPAATSSSSEDEDADDEDEAANGVDTSYISTAETTYLERLRKLREQFDRLYGFVSVGLQAVGRTGGEPCWEVLAERLAWGKGPVGEGY